MAKSKKNVRITVTHDDFYRIIKESFRFLVTDYGFEIAEETHGGYEEWVIFRKENRGIHVVRQGCEQPMLNLIEIDDRGTHRYYGLGSGTLTDDNLGSYYRAKQMSFESDEKYLADIRKYADMGAELLKRYAADFLSGKKTIEQYRKGDS